MAPSKALYLVSNWLARRVECSSYAGDPIRVSKNFWRDLRELIFLVMWGEHTRNIYIYLCVYIYMYICIYI